QSPDEGAKDAANREALRKPDVTSPVMFGCVAAHGDRRDFSAGVVVVGDARRTAYRLRRSVFTLWTYHHWRRQQAHYCQPQKYHRVGRRWRSRLRSCKPFAIEFGV